jgi:Flp pilus assembly protein TadG
MKADLNRVLFQSPRKQARIADERGQAAVEFTLVIPILLLVMTGMLSFGIAMHNFLVLSYGVNSGAQLLAFSRGQTTDPCATASAAIHSAVPGLNSGLSLSFVIDGTTYSSTTSCPAGAANLVQGASAQVTATYPCSLGVFEMNTHTCNLQTQVTEVIQ